MKLKYSFVYIFSLLSISFLPTSVDAGESSQSIEGNNDCAAQLNHSNGNTINCNIYNISYPETAPRINQPQLAPESSKTNYSSNLGGYIPEQSSLLQITSSPGYKPVKSPELKISSPSGYIPEQSSIPRISRP